jgi:hypothetical protein
MPYDIKVYTRKKCLAKTIKLLSRGDVYKNVGETKKLLNIRVKLENDS